MIWFTKINVRRKEILVGIAGNDPRFPKNRIQRITTIILDPRAQRLIDPCLAIAVSRHIYVEPVIV